MLAIATGVGFLCSAHAHADTPGPQHDAPHHAESSQPQLGGLLGSIVGDDSLNGSPDKSLPDTSRTLHSVTTQIQHSILPAPNTHHRSGSDTTRSSNAAPTVTGRVGHTTEDTSAATDQAGRADKADPADRSDPTNHPEPTNHQDRTNRPTDSDATTKAASQTSRAAAGSHRSSNSAESSPQQSRHVHKAAPKSPASTTTVGDVINDDVVGSVNDAIKGVGTAPVSDISRTVTNTDIKPSKVLPDVVGNATKALPERTQAPVHKIVDPVVSTVDPDLKALDPVTDQVAPVVHPVQTVVGQLTTPVSRTVDPIVSGATDDLTTATGAVGNTVKYVAPTPAPPVISSVGDAVKDTIGSAGEGVQSTIGGGTSDTGSASGTDAGDGSPRSVEPIISVQTGLPRGAATHDGKTAAQPESTVAAPRKSEPDKTAPKAAADSVAVRGQGPANPIRTPSMLTIDGGWNSAASASDEAGGRDQHVSRAQQHNIAPDLFTGSRSNRGPSSDPAQAGGAAAAAGAASTGQLPAVVLGQAGLIPRACEVVSNGADPVPTHRASETGFSPD